MLSQTNPGELMSMGSAISAIPSIGREDRKNSESNTSPRSRNPCCSSQARETLTPDRSKWRIWFQKLGPKASLHMVDGGDQSFNPGKGRAIHSKRLDGTATVLEDWLKTQVYQ